jgi:GntR family transcriptional regulator
MVADGLLVRKKGVGTKVANVGIFSSRMKNWMSFSQEMKMLGIEVYNFELHVCWKIPNEEIRSFFGIEDESTNCLMLERLRGKKDFPFVHFISYFNPSIPFTGDENFSNPLYETLRNKFGINVKTSKEELSARLAGDVLSKKLRISPADPVLVRKRLVYDVENRPIEYNIGYYRADSFTYRIESEG